MRNVHRYEGAGFTHVTYERAAAHENSWLMISVLVEPAGDSSCPGVVQVGGGGEGPFELEELSVRRLLRGEEAVGETGRFVSVLEEVDRVRESLDPTIEGRWEGESEPSTLRRLERKVFDA